MAVYLSQRRPSSPSPSTSNIPMTTKKQKAAERPRRRKHYPYPKELATTNMYMCVCKKNLYRRRRDADESMHPTRANGAEQEAGLGEGGGGVIRRQRRRNVGGRPKPGLPASSQQPRTSHGGLTPTEVAAINFGEEEMAWRVAEMRRAKETQAKEARKKGDHTCNLMKQSGDDTLLVDMARADGGEFAEQVAHADRYFDMYINAEAWVGN